MAAKLFLSLLTLLVVDQMVAGKTLLRYRRQLEREDSPIERLNPEVVVVNKDGRAPENTRYDVVGFDPKANKTEDEVDLDIDDDGHFSFGGRLPDFQHFHGSFNQMFGFLNRHFDDMFRRLSSSFGEHHGFGLGRPSLIPGMMDSDEEEPTDVASLPDNYNNTKTELVQLHGQDFIKKTTVIRKGGPNSQIHITSISYRPVDDSENVEPASEVDNVGATGPVSPPEVASVAKPDREETSKKEDEREREE